MFHITHRIHVWYFLPTFTIKINQMQVNIPYMDGMGYTNTYSIPYNTFKSREAKPESCEK